VEDIPFPAERRLPPTWRRDEEVVKKLPAKARIGVVAFAREAAILTHVHSANVLAATFCQVDAVHFRVYMPRAASNLQEYVCKHRPLAADEVLYAGACLTVAVNRLHQVPPPSPANPVVGWARSSACATAT